MRSVYNAKTRFKEERGSEAPVAAVQYQPYYSIGRPTSCPKTWADQVTTRKACRQAGRWGEREKDRHRERQRDRETERQRDRETERGRDLHTPHQAQPG